MKDYWITTALGFVLGGFSVGFGAPSGASILGASTGFIAGYIYFEKYNN